MEFLVRFDIKALSGPSRKTLKRKGTNMKINRASTNVIAACIASILTIQLLAAPLRFTSGTVSGTSVTLNLAGNSNLVCEVQRLDFPHDAWVAQGTLTLSSS